MTKYSKESEKKVQKTMQEIYQGTLTSGKSQKKVTTPKHARAIGLSEARKEGAKVPTNKKSMKAVIYKVQEKQYL